MNRQTLRDAMATAFATTGATTPPWPDPHARRESPLDEEYSRLLDPGKYRILSARWDAWAQALTGRGLAAVEEVDDPVGAWGDNPAGVAPDRVTRLRPVRAEAVPLLLGLQTLDGVPDAMVCLGVGEPAVLAVSLPVCGCDACDDGSDSLLEELDEHVLAVVTGEFVHLAKKRNAGTVTSTGSGWSAEGKFADSPSVDALLKDARAGKPGPWHRVVHGAQWW